jgi:very-short-patch-repair endonuclease
VVRQHDGMLRPAELMTRRQAVAEFGERGLADRLRAGVCVRLFRGVYADGGVPVDDVLRIRAAAMSAGQHLVAVRESAAVVHGFGVLDASTVHLAGNVTEPARSQPGLVVHGMKLAPGEITTVEDVRVTNADRTVVDIARTLPATDALATVDAALRIGACTPESLANQTEQERRLRGIVAARRLVSLGNGLAESPMESRLRMRILDAGLPAPILQWQVVDRFGGFAYRLDLAWPKWRVGVEYDGAGHLDRARQRHDIARRTWLAHAGWTILWATDRDVYLDHRRFLRQLGDVLRYAAA